MLVRKENASLMSVSICMSLAILNGYAPTLQEAVDGGFSFVYYVSPNRWAAEAQYSLSLQAYKKIYDLTVSTAYFGYVT